MTSPATDLVETLSRLVSFRTDCSEEGDERALACHLAELLTRFRPTELSVVDVPRPDGRRASSYVYARFGRPRLLVNAHLDTVPPNADWSSDPFVARVDGDRLYALGSADTKGAAAAILSALDEATPRDTALLFSGDEEFSSVAMRAFVESGHLEGLQRAIVCEPTNLRVGSRHRGLLSFDVTARGPGGHSSNADVCPSPIAELSRIAVLLDAWAVRHRTVGPAGFQGMCLNLAKLGGGVAFNVIPAEARLEVSLRPPPSADTESVWAELVAIVQASSSSAVFRRLRDNPPFATRDLVAFEPVLGAVASAPVDLGFWTEAAILARSGVDAVVIGPGDIAQAHGPDEWVSLTELARAREMFRSVFERT